MNETSPVNRKTVVTRFAPSPTGFAHLGTLRTALFAYLWAKKNSGTFILRIEDTDRQRLVNGSVEHIIASLSWLGIDYDLGPNKENELNGVKVSYFQSERTDIYYKYAKKLIDSGYAYVDVRSEEEVEKLRDQAKSEGRPFLYREHRIENNESWEPGKPLRFKVKDIKEYSWHDETRGELHAGPEALDDFVLIKSDGYPTYNLAHIVDDFEMGVTHIMRADEWLASVPKFLSLYEALSIAPPVFVTVPPILKSGGGTKLSKRDGAKDVFYYKELGYLPQAILNYVAFLGWNPKTEQELFSLKELISVFEIKNINKAGAQFNEERLDFIQKEHMKIADLEVVRALSAQYLTDYPLHIFEKLLPIIRERIMIFSDLLEIEKNDFRVLIDYSLPEVKLVTKDGAMVVFEIINHLNSIKELLDNGDMSSAKTVSDIIMPYAEIHGKGPVLHPLRVALSGKVKSLDPFNLVYILGKAESLKRIDAVIELLKAS